MYGEHMILSIGGVGVARSIRTLVFVVVRARALCLRRRRLAYLTGVLSSNSEFCYTD